MMPDFERDRVKAIRKMWREGKPFDEIAEYVGLPELDVAIIIRDRNRRLPFVNHRTWAEVIRDERAREVRWRLVVEKEEKGLCKSADVIRELLPHVTTPGLRSRLETFLSGAASSQVSQTVRRKPAAGVR